MCFAQGHNTVMLVRLDPATPRSWFKHSTTKTLHSHRVDLFILFCLMFAMSLARLFICALWSPAGKGLTSWLSFVVSNCEFVTFPLVSWVRCGTWLYRLLIFAPLLTLPQFSLYIVSYYWIKIVHTSVLIALQSAIYLHASKSNILLRWLVLFLRGF